MLNSAVGLFNSTLSSFRYGNGELHNKEKVGHVWVATSKGIYYLCRLLQNLSSINVNVKEDFDCKSDLKEKAELYVDNE